MAYEYGKPPIGMALGDNKLFTGADARWEDRWEPPVPEGTATLWHYMSFAKFCSLLERKALFFSLVGDMEDKYEGFIYPPTPRDHGDPLHQAEELGRELLHLLARMSLISCWTESSYESSLMWKAYAGSEGVAIRTTFQRLQKSILSVDELPVTFGRVEYVDYRQKEVSRFGWTPLFHKRMEYRQESEVRAVLPGPPYKEGIEGNYRTLLGVTLDPDVAEQRGRYVPVNLEVLVKEIMLPPRVAPWFVQVVESAIQNSSVRAHVTRSSIE